MDIYQLQLLLRWGIIGVVVVVIAFLVLKNLFKQRSCPECGSTKIRLVEKQLERMAKHLGEHTQGGVVLEMCIFPL